MIFQASSLPRSYIILTLIFGLKSLQEKISAWRRVKLLFFFFFFIVPPPLYLHFNPTGGDPAPGERRRH